MSPSSTKAERLQSLAFPAIAAFVALIPFLTSVSYPFLDLWDDASVYSFEESLRLNLSSVIHWLGCWTNLLPLSWLGAKPLPGDPWRELVPMVSLTHMADYAIAGFSPWIYHLQSLLWHAACAAGLYKCFTLFRVRPWLALVFVAAFAVHPQRAESVVWVSERRDVVYGAFAVWSFYLYAKGRGASSFSPGAFILFVLSLASKPMAAAMPLVLFAFELIESRPFSLKDAAKRLWPYFLAAFLSSMAYHPASKEALGTVSAPMKLFIALHNALWYPLKTLLPLNLCPIYPKVSFDSSGISFVASGFALLLALGGAIWVANPGFLFRKALPYALMSLLSISTVIGLFQVNAVNYADRYSYVFSAFVFFALAWLLSRAFDWAEAQGEGGSQGLKGEIAKAFSNGAVLPAVLCVWLLSLGVSSFFHQEVYKSSLGLFQEACARKNPNPLAILMLANAEMAAGTPDAADRYAARLLSSGLESKIMSPDAAGIPFRQLIYWHFKGLELARSGHPKEALQILLKAKDGVLRSKLFAKYYSSQLLMCVAESQLSLGLKKEALASMDELIGSYDLGPECPDALCAKGVKSVFAGDLSAAETYFEKALSARPSSQGFKDNLQRVKSMRAKANPSMTTP